MLPCTTAGISMEAPVQVGGPGGESAAHSHTNDALHCRGSSYGKLVGEVFPERQCPRVCANFVCFSFH